jgi:hypothetical protein
MGKDARMTSQEEPRDPPVPEEEAHGATPPHGDPLVEPRAGGPASNGPHEEGVPEDRDDTATPPHGDPLR